MKIGEAMYKAEQARPARRRRRGGRRRRAAGKADDKVVDAEFEEVSDKKKVGLIAAHRSDVTTGRPRFTRRRAPFRCACDHALIEG